MKQPHRQAALCLALTVTAASLIADPPQLRAARATLPLPEGAGKEILIAKCQFCHKNDRVVAARLTKDGWAESVSRMIELGAPVTTDEAKILVEYLAANFGLSAPRAPVSSGTSLQPAPASVLLVDPSRAAFSHVPGSVGLLSKVEMFIVSGDPAIPAPFSILLKISAGGVLPASWLSRGETIACLRGSLEIAERNKSERQILRPGTVLSVAAATEGLVAESRHGAIVLLCGQGPLSHSEITEGRP